MSIQIATVPWPQGMEWNCEGGKCFVVQLVQTASMPAPVFWDGAGFGELRRAKQYPTLTIALTKCRAPGITEVVEVVPV